MSEATDYAIVPLIETGFPVRPVDVVSRRRAAALFPWTRPPIAAGAPMIRTRADRLAACYVELTLIACLLFLPCGVCSWILSEHGAPEILICAPLIVPMIVTGWPAILAATMANLAGILMGEPYRTEAAWNTVFCAALAPLVIALLARSFRLWRGRGDFGEAVSAAILAQMYMTLGYLTWVAKLTA